MPRKPRSDMAGMALHDVRRGNNRQAVFYDEQDHSEADQANAATHICHTAGWRSRSS